MRDRGVLMGTTSLLGTGRGRRPGRRLRRAKRASPKFRSRRSSPDLRRYAFKGARTVRKGRRQRRRA